VARFQGGSPYIYPLYGLGELPQVNTYSFVQLLPVPAFIGIISRWFIISPIWHRVLQDLVLSMVGPTCWVSQSARY